MNNLEKFLKEIKERREKATPGPWGNNAGKYVDPEICSLVSRDVVDNTNHESDADFIAHAPQTQAKLEKMLEVAVEALKRIAYENNDSKCYCQEQMLLTDNAVCPTCEARQCVYHELEKIAGEE